MLNAYEVGDGRIRQSIENVGECPALGDDSFARHHHSAGERHGVSVVMGNEDRRDR